MLLKDVQKKCSLRNIAKIMTCILKACIQPKISSLKVLSYPIFIYVISSLCETCHSEVKFMYKTVQVWEGESWCGRAVVISF